MPSVKDIYETRFSDIKRLVKKRKRALDQPFYLTEGDSGSPRGTLYHLATLGHRRLWQAYGRLVMELRRRTDLTLGEQRAIETYQAEARRRKYDKSMRVGKRRRAHETAPAQCTAVQPVVPTGITSELDR